MFHNFKDNFPCYMVAKHAGYKRWRNNILMQVATIGLLMSYTSALISAKLLYGLKLKLQKNTANLYSVHDI